MKNEDTFEEKVLRYVRSAEERAEQDRKDAAEDAARVRYVEKYTQPEWWKESF